MRKIENYEAVQASTGEFKKPTAGGYVCMITFVEDVPMNPRTNKGDYLKIEYDIADGEFKGYYAEQCDKFGNWYASFIRSYKEKALGMLKHFTNCIEESNPGYKWDFNERSLVNKYVGLVLGEEEYLNRDGEVKTKLVVKDVKTVEQIKNGDFKVPDLKKVDKSQKETEEKFQAFETVEDDDLPF